MNQLSADDFTLDAIDRDAQFVGRLVSSTQDKSARANAGIAMLAIAPYLALFVHESLPKLRSLRSDIPAELPDDLAEVARRSRHSLKLFEDTRRGIDDQLAHFNDVLLPAHRARFLGNTWFRPARALETDLGIYRWGRRSHILTTHGVSLSVGLEPGDLLSGDGTKLLEVSTGYGNYFGALGVRLSLGATSFISAIGGSRIQNLDRKSWKLYRQMFPGVNDPAMVGLLFNFACLVDFVHDVLVLDASDESRHTIAKIRFLTSYQVVRSFQLLLDGDQNGSISDSWAVQCRALLSLPEVSRMVGESTRPFRNTLMHYGLDSRMDLARMRIDEPLYGMTEQCFGGASFEDFESDLSGVLMALQAFFHETRGRRYV